MSKAGGWIRESQLEIYATLSNRTIEEYIEKSNIIYELWEDCPFETNGNVYKFILNYE